MTRTTCKMKVLSVVMAALMVISFNPLFSRGQAFATSDQSTATTQASDDVERPDVDIIVDEDATEQPSAEETTDSSQEAGNAAADAVADTDAAATVDSGADDNGNGDGSDGAVVSADQPQQPQAGAGYGTMATNNKSVTYGGLQISVVNNSQSIQDNEVVWDETKKTVTIHNTTGYLKSFKITQPGTERDTSLIIDTVSDTDITIEDVLINVAGDDEQLDADGKGRACIDVRSTKGTVTLTFQEKKAAAYKKDCKNRYTAGAKRAAIEKNGNKDCTLVLVNKGTVIADAGTGDDSKQEGPAAIGSAANQDLYNLKVIGGNWEITTNQVNENETGNNSWGAALGSGSGGSVDGLYVKGGEGARPERGDQGNTGENELRAHAFHGAAIGAGYPSGSASKENPVKVENMVIDGGNIVAECYLYRKDGAKGQTVYSTGPGLGVNLIDATNFGWEKEPTLRPGVAYAHITANAKWMRALSFSNTAVECGEQGSFTYTGGYVWTYGGYDIPYDDVTAKTAYSIHAKKVTIDGDQHKSDYNDKYPDDPEWWALIDSSQSYGIVAEKVDFKSGDALIWGCSDNLHGECTELNAIVANDVDVAGGTARIMGGVQIKDNGTFNMSGGQIYSIVTAGNTVSGTDSNGRADYYAIGVEGGNKHKATFSFTGGVLQAFGGIMAGGNSSSITIGDKASVQAESGSSVVYGYGGSASVPALYAGKININGGATRTFMHTGLHSGSLGAASASAADRFFPQVAQRSDFSKATDHLEFYDSDGNLITDQAVSQRMQTGLDAKVAGATGQGASSASSYGTQGTLQAQAGKADYQKAFNVKPTFGAQYSHVSLGATNDVAATAPIKDDTQSWDAYNRVDVLPAVSIDMPETATVQMGYNKTIDLKVGESQAKATITPAAATVKFSSSNTDVATIDEQTGVIKLVAVGETDIVCAPTGDYQTVTGEPVKMHLTVQPGAGDATVSIANWTYTLNDAEKSQPVLSSNTHYVNNAEITYAKQGEGKEKATEAKPTEVGNYTMYVTLPENPNYNQLEKQCNFTITKAKPVITPSDNEICLVQSGNNNAFKVEVSKQVELKAQVTDNNGNAIGDTVQVTASQEQPKNPDVKAYDLALTPQTTGTAKVTLSTVADDNNEQAEVKTVDVKVIEGYTLLKRPVLAQATAAWNGMEQTCVSADGETKKHTDVTSDNSNPYGATELGKHTTTFALRSGYAWEGDLQGEHREPVTFTWEIVPRDVSKSDKQGGFTVAFGETNIVYDGHEHTPKVELSFTVPKGATSQGTAVKLVEGTDYSVEYADNLDAGQAKVTIKGLTEHTTGEVTKYFTISPIDLGNEKFVKVDNDTSQVSYYYDGTKKTPELRLYNPQSKEELVEGTDYTVTGTADTDAGWYDATVKSASKNYSGSRTVRYNIAPVELDMLTLKGITAKQFDGRTPVTFSNLKLVNSSGKVIDPKNYNIAYVNNNKVGTGTIVVTPRGNNLKGELRVDFPISAEQQSFQVIPANEVPKSVDLVYNGKEQAGVPANEKYEVTGVTGATQSGTYTATVKPADGYAWDSDGDMSKRTIQWRILKANFADGKVEGLRTDVEYRYLGKDKNGNDVGIEQNLKLFVNGAEVPKNLVTINYYNNASVGRAAVTLTYKDIEEHSNYKGTKLVYFNITKATSSIELDDQSTNAYIEEGKAMEDPVELYYKGDGVLTATSADPSVATVEVVVPKTAQDVAAEKAYEKDCKIIVHPVSRGTTSIKVKAAAGANFVGTEETLYVHVNQKVNGFTLVDEPAGRTFAYDGQEHYGIAYDKAALDIVEGEGSTPSATDAGTYGVKVKLKKGYAWAKGDGLDTDNSGEERTIEWKIEPAQGALTSTEASDTTIDLKDGKEARAFEVAYVGDGTPTATSTKPSVADVSVSQTSGSGTAKKVSVSVVPKAVGSTLITVSGSGAAQNYTEVKPLSFYVTVVDTSTKFTVVSVPQAAESLVYNGSPQVGIKAGDGYTLTGPSVNNDTGDSVGVNAGSYWVRATLKPDYAWDETGYAEPRMIMWTIEPADLANAQVTGVENKPCTGQQQFQDTMELEVGGTEVPEAEYEVSYSGDWTKAGSTVTVTATARQNRNYTGSVSKSFTIGAAASKLATATGSGDAGTMATGDDTGAAASSGQSGVSAKPNDPKLGKQYYLNPNKGSEALANGENPGANVLAAWDQLANAEGGLTKDDVTVAVIDTGLDVQSDDLVHPDLKDNIVYDLAKDTYHGEWSEGRERVIDADGHGTHVAGIIAATANNGVGIAGASYNAKILPIKVFDDDGLSATTDDLVEAYEYLGQMIDSGRLTNLKVINMSLGGYGLGAEDVVFEKVVEDFTKKYNVLTVAAGGNGDSMSRPYTEKSYPSDFESVLSVTSLTIYGTDSKWSDYNEFKDISAPGESIYSTFTNQSYKELTGTSMASPLVAGIAALLFAAVPEATPEDVVNAIKGSATKINHAGTVRWNTGSAGAINAAAALQKLLEQYEGVKSYMKDCTVEGPTQEMYTGQAIKPTVVVKDAQGNMLKENESYTVSYGENTKVGYGEVLISGMGDYRGTVRHLFHIYYDLGTYGTVDNVSDQAYADGAEIQPLPKVSYNDKVLQAGRDYTVGYENNTAPGKATVVIKGYGDYWGELRQPFDITGVGGQVTAPVAKTGLVYNGQEQVGVEASTGGNYTIEGNTATEAGQHTATLTLKEGLTWSDGGDATRKITWSIEQATPTLLLSQTSAKLSKSGTTQKVLVSYGGDGKLEVSSNASSVATAVWDASNSTVTITAGAQTGTAQVTVTAKSGTNYKQTSQTITVEVASEPEAQAALPNEQGVQLVYNGQEQAGVLDGDGYRLGVAEDSPTQGAEVDAAGNVVATEPGEYKVNVIEAYDDAAWEPGAAAKTQSTDVVQTVTFTIDKVSAERVNVPPLGSYVYTGSQIKPEVQPTYKGKALELDTDYEVVRYGQNTNVKDTSSVTLSFKGNHYEGTRTLPFQITPANSKLELGKGTLSIDRSKTQDKTQKVELSFENTDEPQVAVTAGTGGSGVVQAKLSADKNYIEVTPSSADRKTGTATISVNAPGDDNHKGSQASITVTVADGKVQVPKAVSTKLVYNRRQQTGVQTGEGYTLTGNTATNAGTYTATATLGKYYTWDTRSDAYGKKTVSWKINPAASTLKVTSNSSLSLIAKETAGTAQVSYSGDGAVTATSSNQAVAKASYDKNTKKVTVTPLGKGTATVIISPSGEKNYTTTKDAKAQTINVSVAMKAPARVEGSGRIETAVSASKTAYSDGSAAGVIIATSQNFPDALAGAGLAGALDYPILITSQGSLDKVIKDEIKRLGAKKAIILGGTSVVKPAVEKDLKSMGLSVERISGNDRYDTAIKIYNYGKDRHLWQGRPIIATGAKFADALSISSYAAAKKAPIFLVPANAKTLSASVSKVLSRDFWGKSAIIVGGEAVVTPQVATAVYEATGKKPGKEPRRLAGPGRYETSGEIAKFCINEEGMSKSTVAFATGQNFPDALAAGPMQAKANGPVVLVKSSKDDEGVRGVTAIKSAAGATAQIRFMGGKNAIAQSLRDTIAGML